jgi:hypothetical protein
MLGVLCRTAKLLLKAVYGIFKHGAHQRRFRISSGAAGSIVEYLVRQPVLSEPPLENNVATGRDGPQEFVLSSRNMYCVHIISPSENPQRPGTASAATSGEKTHDILLEQATSSRSIGRFFTSNLPIRLR